MVSQQTHANVYTCAAGAEVEAYNSIFAQC